MSSIVEKCSDKPCAAGGLSRGVLLSLALFVLALIGWTPQTFGQAPANDYFTNATVLVGLAGTTPGSTVGATIEPGEPFHAGYHLHSVWYTWTAPVSGIVTFDTVGSSFDTVLAVYQGTNVAALTKLGENDDAYGTFGLWSQVSVFAIAGVQYRIAVDGYRGASGFSEINWRLGNATLPPATNGVQFSDASYTVAENTPGFITVSVVAGGGFTNTSTVDFYTVDGSGIAGIDYISVSNTLTFEPGEMLKTITIPILDNAIQDSNRTVNLVLTNATGDATLGSITNATLLITDDETPVVISQAGQINIAWPDTPYEASFPLNTYLVSQSNFFLSPLPNYLVTENETTYAPFGTVAPSVIDYPARSVRGALITVTRSAPAVGRVLVDYYTTNLLVSSPFGTNVSLTNNSIAVPGRDYYPVQGTLMFDDYQMSANFIVPVYNSLSDTNDKFFNVVVSNARPAPEEDPVNVVPTVGPQNYATVQILKVNGPLMGVSFERATYRADEFRTFPQGTTNVVTRGGTNFMDIDVICPNCGDGSSATISLNRNRYVFPLLASSDYSDTLLRLFDNTPYTDGTLPFSNTPDYVDQTFTVTFSRIKKRDTFRVAIIDDGTGEFNEDIFMWIESTGPPNNFGPNRSGLLTIVYDDQPAGAADREWNSEGVVYTNPRFNNTPGANNTVAAIAVQPDNKTVIAGDFDHYNSFNRAHVARINPDGSLDTTFAPGTGADGAVDSLVLYPTSSPNAGKMLIGGAFGAYNGTQRNGIARLNANGTLDASFNPGNGADNVVRVLALQNDGKVIVAGDFITFNDTLVNGIVRLNTNGTIDTSFNVGSGADGTVWAVAVSEDAATSNRVIYVAGDFATINGVQRTRLARLANDGSVDLSFDPGLGADNTIYAIALQTDGKILLGGAFNQYHTFSRSSLVRINLDGTVDETYNVGTGADDSIYAIALQPDGKAIIGGIFTSYNTTRRMGLARVFTSGSLDTSFMDTAYNQFAGLPKTFSFDNPSFVNCLALDLNTNIMIGGSFTNVGGNLSINFPYDTNTFDYSSNGFYNYYLPINGRTNGHNSGGHWFAPFTRADKTTRFNVAKIVGGYTLGPGNIELDPNSEFTANENNGTLTVTLRRVDGRLGTAAAESSTVDDTATYPNDYTSASGIQVWDEYDATINAVFVLSPISVGLVLPQYYKVPLVDDSLVEGDETFGVIVSNSFGSITLSGEYIPLGAALGHGDRGNARISDDDSRHGIFNFALTEYVTNENAVYATISVVRSNGSVGSVSVDYYTRTNDSTATAGVDYTFIRGTLRFNEGVTTNSFLVRILDNPEVEQDEYITLVLTNATGGAKLPGGAATSVATSKLTIIDDDFLPGRLQFSSLAYTNNENDGVAVLTITRTGGNVGAMTVQAQTVPGGTNTATAWTDYTPVTNTLVWADGDSSARTISVPLISDGMVEGVESVLVRLTSPSVNGSLGSRSNAVLFITDGDAYGQFTLMQPYYEADENGLYPTITVLRGGGSAGTVSVNFATMPFTAVAGVDYRDTNGVLVFGPGEFSKTFQIPIIDNGIPDGERTFQVTLSNPTNGTLGAITNALVSIVDNESINLPAGSLDTTFSGQAAADGAVYALIQQVDGAVVMAGDFTHVSNVPRNRLARLKPAGTLDGTFDIGPGANGSIRALGLQSDGRLYVGGLFTSINGTNINGIARLAINGSVDSSFNPGSGANAAVYSILVQPNDKVLVGGAFSSFSGVSRPGLVRLNTNGTIDASFTTGSGFSGTIYALGLQNDGKVIVGGDFTSFNGQGRTNLLRLNANGSLDTTFPALAINAAVRAIVVEADGRILIGGSFTNINGLTRNYAARILANGQIDSSFLAGGVQSGGDGTVFAIKQQIDGRIVLVGDFQVFNGVTRNSITRINDLDGSTDPSINFGNGANGFVSSLIIQPDRKMIIGGGFTAYDDQPRQHIARIYGGSIAGSGALEYSAPSFVTSEAGTNALITVRRRGGTAGSVSVNYTTANGTAIAGRDYLATAGTLTFPLGETRLSFNVPIVTNNIADGDRTLYLLLSNFVGAVQGPQPFASLTIQDDESTVGFGAAFYSFGEATISSNATITLVRQGGTNFPVTVWVGTYDVTATAGLDYIATNGPVTFLPGETAKNFNVRILDDALIEGNEDVGLYLTNASGFTALSLSNATLTIVDNDFGAGQFVFATNNFVFDESAGFAVVTVLRTNGSTGVAGVRLATSDGTAVNGLDYRGTNRVLTFADGETAKSLAFPILNDSLIESDETIILTLSNPTGGATIQTNSTNAIVTIADDEISPSYLTFATNTFTVNEADGFATITVVRTNSRRGVVSIDYSISNGSALAPDDYLPVSGTLIFGSNEVAKTFTIPIVNDTLGEGDETVKLTLSNPVAISSNTSVFLSAGGNLSTLVIQDNDATVLFSPASYTVAENATNAVITVIRKGVTNNPMSVTYLTATGGTAIAGIDYQPVVGTLSWAAGEITPKTFLVPILDNTGVNPAKTVFLALTNAVGITAYVEAPSTAILTITDNETVDPSAGVVDPTFAGNIGANATVNAVAFDAQQRLIVGGDFTQFHGLAINRIARLTTNGAVDILFNVGSGADNSVFAVLPVTNGGVYVAGSFTNLAGFTRAGIGRLTDYGTLDSGFDPGLGADSAVRALGLLGTNLYVAGDFTALNGVPSGRIARLGTNGAVDAAYSAAGGANGPIRALAVQPDGRVIIGGDFTAVAGFAVTRLARLNADGTFDNTFNVGYGADAPVRSLLLQADGKILVAGEFLTINGSPRAHIARLNANGSVDLTFNPGTGANSDVRSLAMQADGRILAVGLFTSFNGNSFNRIARLNADGSLDAYLGIGSGADNAVNSVATYSVVASNACTPPAFVLLNFDNFAADGSNYLSFTTNCVTLSSTNGFRTVTNLNSGGTAAFLAAGSTLNLSVSGRPFTMFGTILPGSLGTLRLTAAPSGETLTISQSGSFAFPLSGNALSVTLQAVGGQVMLDDIYVLPVLAPVALPTDRIAVGGDFSKINGVPRSRVAMLDYAGALDATFDPGAMPFHSVYALDTYTNTAQPSVIGKVLAGGDFTALVGVEGINHLGRLNLDGTIDKTFNSGVGPNDTVRALAVQPDGKAVIGGFFTTYDFLARTYLARVNVDGTLDNTFNSGASLDNAVLALALQPDGRIVVGGAFTMIYGAPRAFIGRVHTNGTVDTNFVCNADGIVRAVALQPDGKVLIGGDFTHVNGIARSGVARLNTNGSVDATFDPGTGTDGSVTSVAYQPAFGQIVIGGAFTQVNGTSASRIARLNGNGSVDSSFAVGSGANDTVAALKVQPDGKLLVAGNFTIFNGLVRNRLARLNSDGTFDAGINFGTGANNLISAIALQSYDNKIVVGGGFTTFDDEVRVGIARLFAGNNVGNGAFEFAVTNYTVNEASNSVTLAVVRTGGTYGTVSVSYATANGTATSPADFTATSGTLTFGQAENVKYITVVIRDNAATNLDKTFTVSLSAPTGGATLGSATVATVRILDNDSVVSFSAASYTVNENGGAARITVVRTGGATDRVAVDYATGTNGTATAGVDFTARAGTLVFNPGVRVQTFDIPITDDTQNEFNETVPLSLFNLSGPAVLGLTNATLTIVENDFAPGAIAFSATAYATNEDAGSIVISVYRTNGYSGIVTVGFATLTNGTATSGVDFYPTNGILVFADGQTNATFTVQLIDDLQVEGPETVPMQLFGVGGGATLTGANATLTIVDNDQPGQFIFSQPVYNVTETGGVATITVLRINGNIGNVSVTAQTVGGTATAGTDYTGVSTVLSFGVGETIKTFNVPIINDTLVEGTETVGLQLLNPTGGATIGATNNTAVLNIIDDEVSLTFGQATYTVVEGNTNALITIYRIGDTNSTISVGFNTSDGTATAYQDYFPVNTTLVFAPGETNKTFLVGIIDDTLPEGDETVNLTLSNPSPGVSLGSNFVATLTIVDNDVSFSFSSAVYSVVEGQPTARIWVVRSGTPVPVVSVEFATFDATATAPLDYTTTTGRLNFASGQVSNFFDVPIVDDLIVENVETLNLALSNPSTNTFLGGQSVAVLNITDNDTSIYFQRTNIVVSEKVGNASITILRAGSLSNAVNVTFRTGVGTATAGADYGAANYTVTFNANQSVTNVLVSIVDDGISEGAETVPLQLLNPTGGAIIDTNYGTGTLTIVDNGGAIAFASATYTVAEGDGSAVINLIRTGGSNGPVTVNWAVSPGGTAIEGLDYFGSSGTVVFANGETVKPILLPINDDGTLEGVETVNLRLVSAADGAYVGSPATAQLRILDNEAGIIVPSGSSIVAESRNVNSIIESNEIVTILLALRNAGTVDDVIIATLQTNLNVLATNSTTGTNLQQQNYGTLVAGGNSAFRPFTFLARGTNGTRLSITLLITNGVGTNLGSVSFDYTIGTNNIPFANAGVITILDRDTVNSKPANPYPATLTVSGVSGQIDKLTVTLYNVTHNDPRDLDVALVGPDGRVVMLMSDAGWGGAGTTNALNNVTFTFDDASTNVLPYTSAIVNNGVYRPANYEGLLDPFPAPGPGTNAVSTSLSDFIGSNPNGVWSLYIVDDAVGSGGSIAGGWSLNIKSVDPIIPGVDLGVTVKDSADPALTNSIVTYTISVTNFGPSAANNIVVTNILSQGATVTSFGTNGNFSVSGNTIKVTFASLAVGAGTNTTLQVLTPNVAGGITLDSTVTAGQTDGNPANNHVIERTSIAELAGQPAPPVLFSARKNNSVVLSWQTVTNVVLQSKAALGGSWANATNTVVVSNGVSSTTEPLSPGTKFFRLKRTP